MQAENQTEEPNNMRYALFTDRVIAYLLDALITGLVTLVIYVINIINFKSFLLYLLVAIVAILYKPFLEYRYGATLGKMVLKLKVTTRKGASIGFKTSVIRSLIFVLPSLLVIPFYYMAFTNTTLVAIGNMKLFIKAFYETYPLYDTINFWGIVLFVIDAIVLLTYKLKQGIALHDVLAGTRVVTVKK